MRAPVAVLLFAFLEAVSSEPVIEAQDPSLENNVAEINVKRHHSWCSRRCYYHKYCQSGYYCDSYRCCRPNNQRPCSHHVHCPQGWYCDYSARLCKVGERRCTNHYQCYNQICVGGKCRNRECYYHQHCKNGYYCESPGICKALCTSDSACKDSQCCAKYNSGQTYGICKDLKKPEEWCLLEPSGYQCGCAEGYECKKYNYYWGKCKKKPKPACSSDSSCQKTHCCSGGQCKPRKKAKEWCPHKGADIYHCGCIEGYTCTQYEDNVYWGRCEQIVPPTEEPGSGFMEVS